MTNIKSMNLEYIIGTSENILKYVLASASAWVVSNPVYLDDKEILGLLK